MGVARAEGLDLIAVRQAGYAMQGGDFAFIRSVVAAKGDVKHLEVPAKAIAKWAAVIPTLFPKGTETGQHQGPAGNLVRPGRLPENRAVAG